MINRTLGLLGGDAVSAADITAAEQRRLMSVTAAVQFLELVGMCVNYFRACRGWTLANGTVFTLAVQSSAASPCFCSGACPLR